MKLSDYIGAPIDRVLAWAETQPWARAMSACGQDAHWHAEGDVWMHTRMVCAELERLDEWPALERDDQLKLLFTALFHDSGKPATTVVDPETGRTRSPKHSLFGAEIARRVLRELGCDLATREEIVALVRYHGRPPYLLEKPRPEHEIISLSWLVNHRLLHLFALADTRGRKTVAEPTAVAADVSPRRLSLRQPTPDPSEEGNRGSASGGRRTSCLIPSSEGSGVGSVEQHTHETPSMALVSDHARAEENLHLWKQLAEELGCFGRPYAFANDQARFLFYRDELSSLHYVPHEAPCCTVTLMSGLPAAGKDTWLATHRPELPVVSLDAIRTELDVDATDNQGTVIQSAREQCREHLRAGLDFAFNATNLTRQMRRRWIDLFADYDARIEIVYLEPPLETVLARNRKRTDPVPEKVILRLLEKLEPPTWAEGHRIELVG